MKFIELHHGESTIQVRADKVIAVTDLPLDTAVHLEGQKHIFYVDESVKEVLDKIQEAKA